VYAEGILDKAKEIGIKSVKFNWRGEALLYPDLVRVVEYAKKLGFVDLMLNTRLPESKFLTLTTIANLINTLKISLDNIKGAKKDVFPQISFLKTFRRVVIQRRITKDSESLASFREGLKSKIGNLKNIKIIQGEALERNKEKVFFQRRGKVRVYCGQPARRIVVGADERIRNCCCHYAQDGSSSIENAMVSRKIYINHLRRKNYNMAGCHNCVSKEGWK
jgi:hypothetical protein